MDLPVWLGTLEDSSNTRAKTGEKSEAKRAKGLLYQTEVETEEYSSASNGSVFTATMTRRVVVTPKMAWHRVLAELFQRDYDDHRAREMAWLEQKKTAMSYVYFCMAQDRLVTDYPPALWTLGRMKMLHTRIRNTNRNAEPKRLPGLRWILTAEQTESQHAGEFGLKSPLALEQAYCKLGVYSIPSGAAMEKQIIRSIDLKRAMCGLTPLQQKILDLRLEGLEPALICQTLFISRKAYESICRSLGADRGAGKELRKRLEPYDHAQGRVWLQWHTQGIDREDPSLLMRMGYSKSENRPKFFADEAEWREETDRGEPIRTNLTRFVTKGAGAKRRGPRKSENVVGDLSLPAYIY